MRPAEEVQKRADEASLKCGGWREDIVGIAVNREACGFLWGYREVNVAELVGFGFVGSFSGNVG